MQCYKLCIHDSFMLFFRLMKSPIPTENETKKMQKKNKRSSIEMNFVSTPEIKSLMKNDFNCELAAMSGT